MKIIYDFVLKCGKKLKELDDKYHMEALKYLIITSWVVFVVGSTIALTLKFIECCK